MNEQFTFGTLESEKDYRTIIHDNTLAVPLVTGGYDYLPNEINNQHRIGKCTAASTIQNAEKALGKKFSDDFQYLLQKKFIDGNWIEGSSIFSALKVGTKYGFLPIEQWTYTTEQDSFLSYAEWIAKLQAIPDSDVQRLITLCTDKLTGYAQVDVSTPESIAQAILGSKSGILCRYVVGNEWWTSVKGVSSYNPIDIDPLRPPKIVLAGHGITGSKFDYTVNKTMTLANTFGAEWDCEGNAHVNLNEYPPTEAWIPYYDFVPARIVLPKASDFHPVYQQCALGDVSQAVKDVQTKLMILGILPLIKVDEWGYYGNKTKNAVYTFMKNSGKLSTWEILYWRGGNVGVKTLAELTK